MLGDPKYLLPFSTAHQEWQGLGFRLGKWPRESDLRVFLRLGSREGQEAGHVACTRP